MPFQTKGEFWKGLEATWVWVNNIVFVFRNVHNPLGRTLFIFMAHYFTRVGLWYHLETGVQQYFRKNSWSGMWTLHSQIDEPAAVLSARPSILSGAFVLSLLFGYKLIFWYHRDIAEHFRTDILRVSTLFLCCNFINLIGLCVKPTKWWK